MNAKFPGLPTVINGNGAVAYVMGQVCGGVIGYPITPSTEISEIYEGFRAAGGCNVWGKHPFFYEPEGEHSAQSGALGATLTGGKFISNASSSQGILYGLESHYVTVGKKAGGFVLQVAARTVSRHSLNVMAGHDDAYSLLPAGYTILFGSNPGEAADLAAISYKVSAMSLVPVANCMDGFATSHMMSEASLPEPELLKEFLGDPAGRIKCPTVAQEILFGAKGRAYQLRQWLVRRRDEFDAKAAADLKAYIDANEAAIETDAEGKLAEAALKFVPETLKGQFKRQWMNAWEKGTRQLVPSMVDIHNPGLTGGVQNQPDFQAGAADHRTHFVVDVPRFVKEAMDEFGALTGRHYSPLKCYKTEDADFVMVGLGSVTDDVEAVVDYLRANGRKVGSISVKLLQPFPEAEFVAAVAGKKAITILERSEITALTGLATQALFKARENADGNRHAGIPAIAALPKITTAIFGLGGHDLQSRHLVAAFDNMEAKKSQPFVYLGSTFFDKNATGLVASIQARLKAAYPETEFMALEPGENPHLLPEGAFRVRFHSVGGYGTIATGKLLTDILAGALGLYSKAAPKYGSEKSGAPTNYYITLSPEPVKITNAEIEDVEIVISPDHKVFAHSNPLHGLMKGGTFIMQTSLKPLDLWLALPASARKTIREKEIRFMVVDAFAVASKNAPSEELTTRMMGIAFIGALCGHEPRITAGADRDAILAKVRSQITKKFGAKGDAVVAGNMAVIADGAEATISVPYNDAEYLAAEKTAGASKARSVSVSASMCQLNTTSPIGLFDAEYYKEMIAEPFAEGTIGDAPVLPGTGFFMPAGSAALKDKGLFRRQVPLFDAEKCTACLECTMVCPDAALPSTVHEIDDLVATAARSIDVSEARREAILAKVPELAKAVREVFVANPKSKLFHEVFGQVAPGIAAGNTEMAGDFQKMVEVLSNFPVARTRLFFDMVEKKTPGKGGLYSVGLDPWKCTGCLECLTVCGSDALHRADQDEELLETLQARFEFLTKTANTPKRFTEQLTGANAKRLILDRDNYYAMTGGHGGCRGCGEVTAMRLIMATNNALQTRTREENVAEIEKLVAAIEAKLPTLAGDADRKARLEAAKAKVDTYLYNLESGPSGDGPSASVIANSTGCSSVYASTFPFNPYHDPWVNSLFQDSPALAKGIFEGMAADMVDSYKAIRIAELELADKYDAKVHDKFFKTFAWADFSETELSRLPTVFSVSGDGASYDIGFGALSRLLTTYSPIKQIIINTGVYSNTGGQASTSSLTGQDSDLARIGAAHPGKTDDRKEMGLIASFHPHVFVVQTAAAMQNHFLKNVIKLLARTASPSLIDIYTPCQGEQGIGDSVSSEHARMAVESRTSPLFVHDPDAGEKLSERFSVDGNPDMEEDWTTMVLNFLDADGNPQTKEVPLTPAHFARHEGRFKKQFAKSKPLADDVEGVSIEDYLDLSAEEKEGKTPFIYDVIKKKLVRIPVPAPIVRLVSERRRTWRTLQNLAGIDAAKIDAAHQAEIDALKARYEGSASSAAE